MSKPSTQTKPAAPPSGGSKPQAPPRKTNPLKADVSPVNGRKIVYKESFAVKHADGEALTQEQIKAILGWTEEPADEDWEDNFLFKDGWGKKIRCINNDHNRQLDFRHCLALAQDHLTKNFKLNGETLIVGQTALVLSAQHRLISCVLADQIRLGANVGKKGDQKEYWKDYWPGEVTLSTFAVYGIDESDETTRTFDNVKPRTFADVLFCDKESFKGTKATDRGTLTKMADQAIKMLWHRTGQVANSFVSRRTHSEASKFLDSHQRLKKCLTHILKEDPQSTLSRIIGRGHAAAMMYLMACSATGDEKAEKYQDRLGEKTEKLLDFSLWGKAEEFWSLLVKADGTFQRVRDNLAKLVDPNTGEMGGSRQARLAVLVKAWLLFSEGADMGDTKRMDEELDLKRHYVKDKNEVWRFIDTPSVGGIDVGDPEEKEEDVEQGGVENEDQEEDDLDPVAVAEAAAAERKARAEVVANRLKELREKGNAQAPAAKPAVTPPPLKSKPGKQLRGGNTSEKVGPIVTPPERTIGRGGLAPAIKKTPPKPTEPETFELADDDGVRTDGGKDFMPAGVESVYCAKCEEQERDDYGTKLKNGDRRHEECVRKAGCSHPSFREAVVKQEKPAIQPPPRRVK